MLFSKNIVDVSVTWIGCNNDVVDFLKCGTAKNIKITLEDLDLLIVGGRSDIKEAYPNWKKSEARKIRKYLKSIISDAEKYRDKKSKRVRSK